MSEAVSTARALLIGTAAVGFGISTLFRKLAVIGFHPFQFELVAAATHLALSVPYAYALSHVSEPISWSWSSTLWTIACCIIVNVSNILFMFALRSGHDTGVVSALASASPVVTIMLAFLFLGEQPDWRQALGILLVLIGVIIASGR